MIYHESVTLCWLVWFCSDDQMWFFQQHCNKMAACNTDGGDRTKSFAHHDMAFSWANFYKISRDSSEKLDVRFHIFGSLTTWGNLHSVEGSHVLKNWCRKLFWRWKHFLCCLRIIFLGKNQGTLHASNVEFTIVTTLNKFFRNEHHSSKHTTMQMEIDWNVPSPACQKNCPKCTKILW